VHEDGYSVYSDAGGQIVFFTPKGRAFAEVTPMPKLPPDPVQELVRRNRARGITPDWRSGMPKWRRDHDIPWEIEGAALEVVPSLGEPESHEPKKGEPENDEPEKVELENDKLVEHAA